MKTIIYIALIFSLSWAQALASQRFTGEYDPRTESRFTRPLRTQSGNALKNLGFDRQSLLASLAGSDDGEPDSDEELSATDSGSSRPSAARSDSHGDLARLNDNTKTNPNQSSLSGDSQILAGCSQKDILRLFTGFFLAAMVYMTLDQQKQLGNDL